jgi:hypothetical protein
LGGIHRRQVTQRPRLSFGFSFGFSLRLLFSEQRL